LDGKSLIISLYNPDSAAFGRTIQVGLEDGKLEQEWHTPNSPQATCPQWVLPGGALGLVITTAVEHMPADRRNESSNAGCLFEVLTTQLTDFSILRRFLPLFSELS
ncbi:MAG: SMP-30/gluconolactonase/LRE family protein, partial [Pirellula sp.]